MDQLAVNKEKKLQDEQATVSNLTTLVNPSNLSWLNLIGRLIEDLQAEMGVEIPWKQVSSSEITVQLENKVGGVSGDIDHRST